MPWHWSDQESVIRLLEAPEASSHPLKAVRKTELDRVGSECWLPDQPLLPEAPKPAWVEEYIDSSKSLPSALQYQNEGFELVSTL